MTDADLINRLRDEAFNPRNNLAAQVEFIRAAEALSGLEAENQRLREALQKIIAAPASGYRDRWEITQAEVRHLARAALRNTENSHDD